MRVLIVDDEPLVRTALAKILSKRDDVEVYDSANDAVEALEKLRNSHYDILLLDISMPEVSGFELLEHLRNDAQILPSIIFVTAHDEHAIIAFENQAVDYVLKPFSKERIDKALNVAIRRTAAERAVRLVEAGPYLQRLSKSQPSRMAIKANGRTLFIDPAEVIAVHAEGKYVLLQQEKGSYLLRESISAMADKLEPYGFIRIHRSMLINRSFAEAVQPLPTGEYTLRIKGGKEFTVTRTYKKNLSLLAELWIGTDTFLADEIGDGMHKEG